MTVHAMILAAGMGTRLNAEEGHKILAEVAGKPLIDYHLENFQALGVTTVTIVTGHAHEELEEQLKAWPLPAGMKFQFAYNPDYKLSNGISVLKGAELIDGPFWLSMSDHIFQPSLMPELAEASKSFEADGIGGMLGIDWKLDSIFDMPDANKVRFNDAGGLHEIGKEIEPFDVVDVGFFWCGKGFIDALKAEREERGDCNTSNAVRRLDAKREFCFWDVGAAVWQDVDTPGARAHAEKLVKTWNEEAQ